MLLAIEQSMFKLLGGQKSGHNQSTAGTRRPGGWIKIFYWLYSILYFFYIIIQIMNNNTELSKQLGYYLSDSNIANDEFFYDQLSANKDHFVDIKCFLKCNKVKKLGFTSVQEIVEAIQGDENFELNEDKSMIKRKDLKDLPEFVGKKKSKTDAKEEDRVANPYDKMETVIFSLSLDKEQTVPFRYIQESLLKNHNVFTPYTRFNKNEGNFAVEKKNCTPELVEKLEKEGLKVGDVTLTVSKADGEKLNEFWDKHGHHYNGIIDNLRKDFNKKQKNEKRGQGQQKAKKVVEFEFGGQKYEDINKLKSLFKNILCRNPNNTPLKEKDEKLVKELLSYHEKAEQKLANFKHFVVDVNPTYVDTRCLFVVREDGTREDFSIVKCISNVENKYRESD